MRKMIRRRRIYHQDISKRRSSTLCNQTVASTLRIDGCDVYEVMERVWLASWVAENGDALTSYTKVTNMRTHLYGIAV